MKPKKEVLGGLPPKGDFTAIYPVDPGISSRGCPTRHNGGSRYEPQLHEAKGDLPRELQGIHYPRFTLPKIGQGQGRIPPPSGATPTASAPTPTSSSEPAPGSHQANRLVENHFQPQPISE
jgi:hypothetical protein